MPGKPPWFTDGNDSGSGPPWRERKEWHEQRDWRRSGFLFIRFVFIFGLIALLVVVGGMALLALLLVRVAGGSQQLSLLVWLGGCSLSVALPLLALGLTARAFSRFVTPLTDIMNAADAVADGDLSVRLTENRPGEFARLARSFNRMTVELERADRQRRNLTADVAHELRTPLHIIQGNLEGIIDGIYEPTPQHVESILEETALLSRLVEDLRTLSLAEGGQLPLHLEAVNVAELLTDVQTSFSGQAEAAGVKLQLQLPASTALQIQADADRLNQVLTNLVANALRHTAAGGSITLSAEPQSGGVRISVKDNGEGIAAEDLPYIFDRFWRADPARSHVDGSGAGLGLAIARQLVEAHQGQIEVQSAPGQGTTFRIELPLPESPPSAAADQTDQPTFN